MTGRIRHKKTAGASDWHPADVIAALRKAGWSVRSLSKHHGYNPNSLGEALSTKGRRWPHAEKLIAEAIGLLPEQIWPTRYPNKDTKPRRSAPAGRTAA